MYRNEIIRKISDLRELGLPTYHPRSVSVPIIPYSISTVLGARRTGKSFRVLQIADELIKKGELKSLDFVCHLDFDNPILASMTSKDLSTIPEVFLSITPEADLKSSILFIFDELHTIENWELFTIELSRNPNWKVVVTGSSSKLLHDNVSTELRGKNISTLLLPLSFKEFLSFNNQEVNSSTSGMAKIRSYFDEYIQWGSYPIIPSLEKNLRSMILREYFDTMILKDIIQRYSVSKPRQCTLLYNYLLSCMGKPITTVSSHHFLKSIGENIGRETVTDWIKMGQESYLFNPVTIFSDSLKTIERNYKKIYVTDWALAHFNSRSWDGAISRTLENIVYIHLIRKSLNVNYYLTHSDKTEVDFIISEKNNAPIMLIQVCMNINDIDTYKREISPLIKTAKHFNIKDNFIITMDQEKDIIESGVSIKAIPIWKWLLLK